MKALVVVKVEVTVEGAESGFGQEHRMEVEWSPSANPANTLAAKIAIEASQSAAKMATKLVIMAVPE